MRDLNRAGISTEDKNKEWVFSSSFYSHELNALVSLLNQNASAINLNQNARKTVAYIVVSLTKSVALRMLSG